LRFKITLVDLDQFFGSIGAPRYNTLWKQEALPGADLRAKVRQNSVLADAAGTNDGDEDACLQ
jgi:hypothetical protein